MFRVDQNQKTYNKSDYDEVYYGENDEQINKTEEQICEILFAIFNLPQRPSDYKGHSMSVGDIVEFDSGNAYICDMIGWKRIKWAK